MLYRKIVSLSIALSFAVLCCSGILSFFYDYSRVLATIHTVFGFIFSVGILLHVLNNRKPISSYSKGLVLIPLSLVGVLIFSVAYFELPHVQSFMDFGARFKANSSKNINLSSHEVLEMDLSKSVQLSIDLLRSEHYWHPQMAVWVEDLDGKYIESIFVSKATAEGLFFGGRSKDNFKEFDGKVSTSTDYRRVDALPVWSHSRGVMYSDGMYAPTRDKPLPDAITGATIQDNFHLISSIQNVDSFRLRLELNVAFDDNEYYSEYDYPDDAVFHNGTGQLGQPSIVFSAEIDANSEKKYYLMDLIGHGHHSGMSGRIFKDLSKLTTAKDIVERIVVGVKRNKKEATSI